MKRAKGSADETVEAKNPKVPKVVPPPLEAEAPVERVPATFKGYSLLALEVPRSAWPQQGPNKGSHSYTVKAFNGAVIWV